MSFKPLKISDFRDWNLIQPKKRKTRAEFEKNNSSDIELSNSFEALLENDAQDPPGGPYCMDGVESSGASPTAVKEKKSRIPPLVIYIHIDQHVKTLKEIQKDCREKLTINFKRDRMIIYTKKEHDYLLMRQKIEAAQVSFHTYSLEKEKSLVSILKGLPANISTFEIKEELQSEHNLHVEEVKQFIKKYDVNGEKREIKLPIFSVKFKNGTSVADVKKVRSLWWCKPTWHRNVPRNSVTQCYRCQAFGHIAKNCFRPEKCAKCAENHNTLNCSVENPHRNLCLRVWICKN